MALIDKFKDNVKKTAKINAIIKYMKDKFTKLFNEEPLLLINLDNIDTASKFGIKNIIQPCGNN